MFLRPCQALGFSRLLLICFASLCLRRFAISAACDYDLSFKTLSSAWDFSVASLGLPTVRSCWLRPVGFSAAVRSAEPVTVAQGFPSAQVFSRSIFQPPSIGRGQAVSKRAQRITKKVFTLRTLASWVNNAATTAAHAGMSRATAMSTKSGPGETR